MNQKAHLLLNTLIFVFSKTKLAKNEISNFPILLFFFDG